MRMRINYKNIELLLHTRLRLVDYIETNNLLAFSVKKHLKKPLKNMTMAKKPTILGVKCSVTK